VGFVLYRSGSIISSGNPETEAMNMMSHPPVMFPKSVDDPGVDIRLEAMSAKQVGVLLKLLTDALAAMNADSERASIHLAHAIELLHPATSGLPESGRGGGGLAGWQIQRVDHFIDLHLEMPIRTPQLAAICNLSVSHFTHAFKQTLGVAPLGYVARRRIESARRAMLVSSCSLTEIALGHGFCDQSHFCRTFRREVGISPNVWRRMFGQGASRRAEG